MAKAREKWLLRGVERITLVLKLGFLLRYCKSITQVHNEKLIEVKEAMAKSMKMMLKLKINASKITKLKAHVKQEIEFKEKFA